jgi:hypothetical protein
MPRKLSPEPNKISPQHAAKVYFSNEEEALLVRARVIMVKKNMSSYIRDLIMEDLTRARFEAECRNKLATAASINPQSLPPGFTPGDEITFFTPEQIQEQEKLTQDRERELEELLKEI